MILHRKKVCVFHSHESFVNLVFAYRGRDSTRFVIKLSERKGKQFYSYNNIWNVIQFPTHYQTVAKRSSIFLG